VYSENGSGSVAVVDQRGVVPLAKDARHVLAGRRDEVLERLREAVEASAVHLGVATMVPQVALVYGGRILDMSDAHRPEEIVSAAAQALDGHEGTAVAVVWR
jgi:hypothetical protein